MRYIFSKKKKKKGTMGNIKQLNMCKIKRTINAKAGKNWTELLGKTKFKTKIR